ncbi:MAG: hypothetical protein HUJ56_00930, partial [Erysipelotrichaceae bacterium]|nr:hypothetical protein [Erysipelotrichaceae bacterium]
VSIQEDKDYLYQHILLELVTQYPPESYYVVFIGDQKDLEARSELWYIQSSYYKDKHLCAWNQESLQVIESLVSSVQLPVIFMVFKPGLLPKEKKDHYFYLLFEKECFHEGEGVIELKEEQGIFKTRKEVYAFTILPHTFDLVEVLQRIFELKNKEVPVYHQELTQEGILQAYKRNRAYEGLKVVVGLDEEGNEVSIDLSEKGQGPHCLLAGTTGSGKSLFLMNWILQLALKYSYEQVQFALIDFKGGGLVTAFDNPHFSLPHLRGSLSNLDLNETERVLIALKKECQLRESLFITMQQLTNKSEMNMDIYLAMNEKYHYLPDLAHLMVIVDEFAELKASYPESMDELISLSRIGRSLGIHLILCTQKPSGVVNEQIWSNARLKLCLKVGSKSDSQEMIESAEAFGLRNPGEFYGYYDNQRFYGKAFYPFEAWNKEESQRVIVEKDLQLNIVHQRIFDEGGLNYFQKAISCIPKGYKSEPLWLKPLDKVTSVLPCVGIIDDIDEIQQTP